MTDDIQRTKKTAEEHYKVLDQQMLYVLRASKAQVNDDMMDQLFVYDRLLRAALGLPLKLAVSQSEHGPS